MNNTVIHNKIGYKKTKLGWIPEDWVVISLDEIVERFIVPMRDKPKDLTGEIPWCRIEDFDGKYLIKSKTSQGVSESTIKDMNLKIYPKDTVLVSCSANLGICAIVGRALVTNQTFIGLTPTEKIDKELLYYIMKWSAHRLNRLSSGTTISYLSREEFEKFKIVIPKKFSEQRKIAQILSTWDEAIEKQEQLILKKGTLKKGLMQQLLTGKKRFAWFTEEWKFVRLGDVLDYEQPTNYIVESTDYNNSFKIPVLTAGKTFVLGFTNEEIGIFKNNLPVIIFDDFTTANKFVDFPFKVKSSAMKILKIASEDFDIKFLFEKIQLINFMPTDHKRYWISQYSDIEIKVPSYREQKKIADVLSAADNEIENLQQKLDILKEQKKGLMQKLLTGEVRVKV